ncbi:16S rRNA (guanine(527)-N(7))-methyltransferase RsmG [Palleronia sediminis]|uniref:Ribosomal RNA small subunit methyltransferase G n=1 Tax=Palleronia sediminis TaxID=2547833 RepID=A0A4V3B988_9RHOB|nr:16S rRNA (guanine(527)-N(7))-methyltransferase RsmG [Palleronia sediminis]TDL78319.1 16S rRNA (guanine(527)-N(7))-methyltransferase RsmG [Palleronia sediminis]
MTKAQVTATDREHRFAALVKQWNRTINLVARGDETELFDRHFADSRQVATLLPNWSTWCDLGSGGGFPGVLVAIYAPPSAQTTLIESDTRKSVFLRTVIRDLGLQAQVLNERIEAAAPQYPDVISARALAPLTSLLSLAERHARPDTVQVYPKGARAEAEIEDARRAWDFSIEHVPSRSDPSGTILVLRNVRRVG